MAPTVERIPGEVWKKSKLKNAKIDAKEGRKNASWTTKLQCFEQKNIFLYYTKWPSLMGSI